MQTEKKALLPENPNHKARRPGYAKEERNGPPSANQGRFIAKPFL